MRTTVLVSLCGLSAASVASAGAIGVADVLNLQVVSGGNTWNLADNLGTVTTFQQNMAGLWTIEGTVSTVDWDFDWGIQVSQATGGLARGVFDSGSISTSFTFTNNTGDDAALFEVIANAVVGPLSGPTEQTGQISGSLGSGMPVAEVADLYTPSGDFLYTALVDGTGVQTLLDDTFSLSTNLTAPFNSTPFLDQPGGGVLSTIGIRTFFGLTDGDNANFVGVFVVNEVPAPGPAVLIGLGGLAAARRRR